MFPMRLVKTCERRSRSPGAMRVIGGVRLLMPVSPTVRVGSRA